MAKARSRRVPGEENWKRLDGRWRRKENRGDGEGVGGVELRKTPGSQNLRRGEGKSLRWVLAGAERTRAVRKTTEYLRYKWTSDGEADVPESGFTLRQWKPCYVATEMKQVHVRVRRVYFLQVNSKKNEGKGWV